MLFNKNLADHKSKWKLWNNSPKKLCMDNLLSWLIQEKSKIKMI